VDVNKLVKGRPLDNMEFMQWLKFYFEGRLGCHNMDYDPVGRRSEPVLLAMPVVASERRKCARPASALTGVFTRASISELSCAPFRQLSGMSRSKRGIGTIETLAHLEWLGCTWIVSYVCLCVAAITMQVLLLAGSRANLEM
jgi:hypothetical protein